MSPGAMDIYGGYADGYCEDLAASALPHFYHAAGSVNFSRLPAYPLYTLRFEQATERSAGNDTVAYAPLAQDLYIRLTWPRMSKTDRENLETFFTSVVNGMGKQFTYSNNFIGPALPVFFADAALPVMQEVAFEQYQVQLNLRVAINYPRMTSSGALPAITGNRFVFGSVAMPFPVPIKGGTGHGLAKQQSVGRDSAGEVVCYDKSRILQLPHKLVMRLSYDQFVSLQSFFFSFVHGSRNLFTWVDQDGVSRSVRLAGDSIAVQQLGYGRFQAELSLIEEKAA